MKKYTIISYTALIVIVLLFGFFVYKVSGKNGTDENVKSKTLSEVKYLESKFLNLFNQVNNISFENYTISAKEVKKESKENKTSNTSGGSSSEGESSNKQGGSEKSENNSEETTEDTNNKQYNLERTGVLTQNQEIDWKQIKNDIEDIYTSLYPVTLDLYQTTTDSQDIVNFNKEYDNLTKAVKDENKEDTLEELTVLYDYLPKFIENCTDDEKEKIVIKTKNNIFKAYSVLDKEEWATIAENINNATQEFTKIVTNVNDQKNKNQYTINKAYVMANELQNAVLLKDKEVFLIKYKNLLEEIQNI